MMEAKDKKPALIHRVESAWNANKWATEDGHVYKLKKKGVCGKAYMICFNTLCRGTCRVIFEHVPPGISPERGLYFPLKPHTIKSGCSDKKFMAVQRLRKRLMERARNENTPNSVIFQQEIFRAPPEIRNRLHFKEVERSMQRAHKSGCPGPAKTFKRFDHLIKQWTQKYGIIDGELFYLGHFGSGDDECMVAAVLPILNCGLKDSKEWHLVGMFDCRPKEPLFDQLFVIMATEYGRAFPVFWALMKTRSETTYSIVFEAIKEYFPKIKPQIIISDYEKPLKTSVQEHFPYAQHVGSWFHFCQAIERNARKLGILPGENDGWTIAKRLMTTALLPAEMIYDSVYLIEMSEENSCLETKDLIQYFKIEWINIVTPESFSVYGQPTRTNNCPEILNRIMSRIFTPQANTWDFWSNLIELSEKEIKIYAHFNAKEHLWQGNEFARKKRNRWLLQNAHLRKLQKKVIERGITLLTFLDGAGVKVIGQIRSEAQEALDVELDSLGVLEHIDDSQQKIEQIEAEIVEHEKGEIEYPIKGEVQIEISETDFDQSDFSNVEVISTDVIDTDFSQNDYSKVEMYQTDASDVEELQPGPSGHEEIVVVEEEEDEEERFHDEMDYSQTLESEATVVETSPLKKTKRKRLFRVPPTRFKKPNEGTYSNALKSFTKEWESMMERVAEREREQDRLEKEKEKLEQRRWEERLIEQQSAAMSKANSEFLLGLKGLFNELKK